MCVIIYAPIGVEFDYNDLRDAFDFNPDGAGLGWVKDGLVSYSKGYVSYKDFVNHMSDIIDDTSMDRVIHFRITSRGKTSKRQCHPFLLSDDARESGLLDYMGKRTIMFMNGTITDQKLITGLNDTASFIIDTLYDSNLKYDNDADLNIISRLTGAKWAIMTTEGVSLVGDFTLSEGRYYSNTYHMMISAYSKDYTNGYGWYDEYFYNYDDKEVMEDEDYYFYNDNENKFHYTLDDLVDGENADIETKSIDIESDEIDDYNLEGLRSLFETDEGKQVKVKNWFEGTLNSIKQLYGGK